MLVVRGTKKLRDRVKGPLADPGDASTTELGDWFATALLWKPQVALLVSERALVPVFMPLAPATTLLDRVPAAIESVLKLHGVGDSFIAAELRTMDAVRLAPTNNRSVVGVMNEFAFHAKFHWKDGLTDVDELSLRMSELPLGPLRGDASSPDRALAALTGSSPPTRSRRHLHVVPTATPTAGSVYQLKITLADTRPPIWRRVLVPSDVTLDRLHEIVQAAFGWWNYHLHEFEIGRARYGMVGVDDDDWDPPKDERTVRLDQIASPGTKIHYTYDFGDHWRHTIEVEKAVDADASSKLPALIDGRRASPPEDCGGTGGYEDLLAVLADPSHPDHAEQLEWIGGAFDPERFDTSEFETNMQNGVLARLDFDVDE
jgi:hypothetical protein